MEEQTPEDTFKTEMDKPTLSEQVEHLTAENIRLKEENENLKVRLDIINKTSSDILNMILTDK